MEIIFEQVERKVEKEQKMPAYTSTELMIETGQFCKSPTVILTP